jgi:hypothetical protein
VWLLTDERRREQVAEMARDLSDDLMMLVLRGTSGFAADVSEPLQEEERERRVRWR